MDLPLIYCPNVHYRLALRNGEVVGMISLHMQFHLHHANWIGEIQELVVLPQMRGQKVGSQLLARQKKKHVRRAPS